MSIQIDRPGLLREKMASGINIFTGAGFSCLESPSGVILPTAKDLCGEICSTFKLSTSFIDDLESLSALAPKQQLQELLRIRYTVSDYNEKYNILNKINILSYITTNIDNIIHNVTDHSKRYYLSSITYYGTTKNARNRLTYIPLHGDVTNPASFLYFGKFDLPNVETANTDLFQLMYSKLLRQPTLFWGYGFHDNGVLKTVSKLLDNYPHDIWVQCMRDDVKGIELFRARGCNVIVGDTLELLDWIDINIQDTVYLDKPLIEKEALSDYFIPTINKVEAIPISDYYQNGNTHWHPILANGSFELPIVNDIYELALSNKNLVVTGGRFTGKSTILMQLALKVDSVNKLYVDKITPEQAKFITEQIGNIEAWLFYHDCAEDIEAFKVFARVANIRLIGISDDYRFESTKHLLGGISYRIVTIEELNERTAQQLFEHIPVSVRMPKFSYKASSSEKYSMFEMISKNVSHVQTSQRVRDILQHLFRNDLQAFDTISLASYLSENGSALSIDVMFSYFCVSTYEDVMRIIQNAMSLLRNHDYILSKDEMDQDYFILRSKLFAYHAHNVLLSDRILKEKYAQTVKQFTLHASPYRILRYDIFRRSAYDSDLFFRLFGNGANDIYSHLYNYDRSPYTLQQWALYLSKIGDYHQAFIDIDNALSQCPNNFSMRNSQAIILFEANRNQGTPLAVDKMKSAMDILRMCYNSDKRKVYHAQRFAEFAIILSDQFSISAYLEEAMRWINEIIKSGDSSSMQTKKWLRELTSRVGI